MRYGIDTYRMYDVCKTKTKKLGVYCGLVDKISPAFELRNSGVPVPAVVRPFQLPALSLSTAATSTAN
jgi:hypothetical protein